MKLAKPIITVLALLAVAYVLVFGPRSDAPPVKDRVVIHYWEKWTSKEGQQMQEIVDDFNNTVGKEKGIYVQYLSMSSINQKTLVSTAAGVPPDVAGLWDHQVPQFAASAALMPLDEIARQYGITDGYYKKVYWDACHYQGKLYALVSTPATVALLYNKEYFERHADGLRAAGLDPNGLPQTLQELDRYADALDEVEKAPNGSLNIKSMGYVPLEPGWWIQLTGLWFGTTCYDEATDKVQLSSPTMIQAYSWIEAYAKRMGANAKAISDFRSGFGNFNSTQNPFLVGQVAMVQQGPWMANYIENLKPSWNRWRVPPEKLQVEKAVADVKEGMSLDEVKQLLGAPKTTRAATDAASTTIYTWDAGIRMVSVEFADGRVKSKSAVLLPAKDRRQYCQWGVGVFPSAVPGLRNVTFGAFDTLVIPKGSKHPKEAFEFVAYVNRQDVMEKLCSLHCKNSPLTKVSPEFIENHPNPYIEIFDELARSPNAHGVPHLSVWPMVSDELNNAATSVFLLLAKPEQALQTAQQRAGDEYDRFRTIERKRNGEQK